MKNQNNFTTSTQPGISKESGLTVLELMVVLVILSLIGAVASVQIIQQLDRAKVDVTKLQISQIENGVELFYLDLGRYPSSTEGLEALISAPEQAEGWRGPYIGRVDQLKDPWGERIEYSLESPREYQLISRGADRSEGGEGADADILGGRR